MAEFRNDNYLQILDKSIPLGCSKTINFNVAKLYTSTKVEIPVIIERSKIPGPTVLITAGVHGDEVNGVEVVRQIIAKKINKPKIGTVICIPVLNVFGFLHMNRYFPDGRDLNRVFPGTKNGSLASRFAYQFVQQVLPAADLCLDFHTGGGDRFNAPHLRVAPQYTDLMELAKVFSPPFILESKNLENSYRATCAKKNIQTLLFEGGKSRYSDRDVAVLGVEGTMRIMQHLGMLHPDFELPKPQRQPLVVKKSYWIRARYSGLLHIKIPCGKLVTKGETMATITDPYGSKRHVMKAPNAGYVINVNESAIVYKGDAVFRLTKILEPV